MPDTIRALIDVHKHQFSLEDADMDAGFDGWTNNWTAVHVGVAPGLLTVFTTRADGRVPVSVRVLDHEPSIDLELWSSVVLASLTCPSGTLVVTELAGDDAHAPTLALPPVPHQALVCMGNVDTASYDGADGADHYLILLWPGPPQTPTVLKPRSTVNDPVRKARLARDRGLDMLGDADPHVRYLAFAELSRHGDAEALDAVWAAAGSDDVDRYLATCALDLHRPLALDRLAPVLDDPSPAVRMIGLRLIQRALYDYEADRHEPLDVDATEALLGRAQVDADPAVKDMAAQVADDLEPLADEMRALRGVPEPPQAPSRASSLEIAIRLYLERLIEEELVEIDPSFRLDTAVESLVEALEARAHRHAERGAIIAEAVLELPGVVDLFATDAQLERLLP